MDVICGLSGHPHALALSREFDPPRGRPRSPVRTPRALPAALCPALAWCFTPRGRSGATKRPKALGCQLLAQGPPRGHLPGRSTVKPGPHPRARQPGQPGQAPDQRRQHREHAAAPFDLTESKRQRAYYATNAGADIAEGRKRGKRPSPLPSRRPMSSPADRRR